LKVTNTTTTEMDPLNPLVNNMGQKANQQMDALLDPLVAAMGQMNIGIGVESPIKSPVKQQDQERNDNELEDDVEEEMAYTPYRPAKLLFGVDHPDPVVENATLSAVSPPPVTYNLAMPASIISEGKLSNLQLEAVVYACQRHEMDLPTVAVDEVKEEASAKGGDGVEDALPVEAAVEGEAEGAPGALPQRAGFLLGDSAGMVRYILRCVDYYDLYCFHFSNQQNIYSLRIYREREEPLQAWSLKTFLAAVRSTCGFL
jgi:hypothetical protein